MKRPMSTSRNTQPAAGFALVMVVLVLLVVTVLAAELTFAVRVGTLEGFNLRQRLIGRALAHGGINQALFYLLDTPLYHSDEERTYLGRKQMAHLDTGRIHYELVNESGKIDLNGASRLLLTTFADYLGLDPEEQEILADSLEDWRDPDNLHRLHGAEDDYYLALDTPYRARNGRCTEVSELALVRGADQIEAKGKIGEIFTVHNPGGKINFNSLSATMLAFLTEDDPEKVAVYHELRRDKGDLSALEAQLILGNERYQQCAEFLSYNDNRVRFFTATASGHAGLKADDPDHDDRPATRITVLFEKTGSAIKYYGWQEEWS